MSANATSGDCRRPRAVTRRAPGSPVIISLTDTGGSRFSSAARAARASLRISVFLSALNSLSKLPLISSRIRALDFSGFFMLAAAGFRRLRRCLLAADCSALPSPAENPSFTPSEFPPSSVDESPSAVLKPLSPLPDCGNCGRFLYRRFIMLIKRPVLFGFCTFGANVTSLRTTLNWLAAAFRPKSCKTVGSSSPRVITPCLHARCRHCRASWSSGAKTSA
mmetsp:Transcript_60943/g.157127  ORF Transcript_60943/g.157127 Transcript_60943/m.157127 type:complete len:221 (+) Transcript_60943:1408-2070(+)